MITPIRHLLTCCASILFVTSLARAQDDLKAALSSHHFSEALHLSEREIARTPTEPRLWLAKGLALNGLGRTDESFSCFDQALKLDNTYIPAAEAGAQTAYRSRDPRALHYLDAILQRQPQNPVASAMRGVLAFEQGDCAAAITYLRGAGDVVLQDPLAEMQLGVCLARTGELAASTKVFEQLHQNQPADAAVTYDLASLYVDAKRFREAIQLLERQRAREGKLDGDAMNLLAAGYAGNDQVVEAIETYRAAIAAQPHDERHYIDLAILSMDHQSPAVALGVLDAGIRSNPRSGALLTMRGSIYAQVAKNEEAQADFEAADRLAPSEMFGTIGLGVLLRDESNLDEAQKVLQAKLSAKPGDPVLSYMLADIVTRKGAEPGQPAFAEAERLLKASLARKPDFAQAHAALGKLMIKAGRLPDAIAELELAIHLDATDRTALNQLVAAYRRSGRSEDATRVAGQLAAAVSRERAQETEKNRVHLIIDTVAAAPQPVVTPLK